MSNLGELVRDKVAENAADQNKIMTKALAIAFVANVLDEHAADLTQEEQMRAITVSVKACEDMQNASVQVTAYDLFLQALNFLENEK